MKSNTLILVFIAAIFGGGVYLWDRQQAQQSETEAVAAGTPLFKFSEDEVKQLKLMTPQQNLTFKKATSGPSAWVIESPSEPADEAAVLFLVNLLATAQSERTLDISPQKSQDFGLDQPAATVVVTLKSNQTHTLILGGKDFSQSSVYARVDPTGAETKAWSVQLVPPSFLDAISRPLEEWKYQSAADEPK